MSKKTRFTEPNVLRLFAASLGTELQNGRLNIPKQFGTGYCTGYVFNEHISMLIMNYELKDDLVIEAPNLSLQERMLLFKFQNFALDRHAFPAVKQIDNVPTVLITTSSVKSDLVTVHSNRATINIEVDADYLSRQFGSSEKSKVLQGLLQNTQSFLFEQIAPVHVQKFIDEMLSERVNEAFKLFHLRVKAEELICQLLMKLEERDEEHLYALNLRDIKALYSVRERILEQLDIPPVIKELGIYAGMSPTKLKNLFKQVFGNSMFSYYQEFRMKKAASLLKEERLSVSDVGYQMGFTNLSHFTRVFETHIGMKPKKYSLS